MPAPRRGELRSSESISPSPPYRQDGRLAAVGALPEQSSASWLGTNEALCRAPCCRDEGHCWSGGLRRGPVRYHRVKHGRFTLILVDVLS